MVLCGRSPVGSSSRARGWVSEAAAGPAEGGRGRGTAKVGDEVRAQSEGHSSACTRRRGMQAPSVAAVASSAAAARGVLEAGEEGRGERAPRADGRNDGDEAAARRGGADRRASLSIARRATTRASSARLALCQVTRASAPSVQSRARSPRPATRWEGGGRAATTALQRGTV